ncbi:MAG: hypothetical protein FWC68_05605 [Oscillospiraceae bacterium]|nr:hypothetical protein [Oscillospiraceae bacterium]
MISQKQPVEVVTPQKLLSLKQINSLVSAKRTSDLFRFRTCCADVRASK